MEDARQQTELAQYADRLKAAQTRATELEKLICRIYEDHVLEKIPDERYEALDSQYTQELQRMKTEITVCESTLAEQSHRRGSAAKFAALFDKYQDFSELTPAMIHQLVEKIVIDAEKLNIGDTVTVGDLEIAKNPKIHLHTDRQAVIVAVTAAHTHQEAAEETEEAAPQE